MKAKAKSFIIIIVTFLIGIVLGIVICNTFMRPDYRKKINRLRTPEGFIDAYERIIQPEAAEIPLPPFWREVQPVAEPPPVLRLIPSEPLDRATQLTTALPSLAYMPTPLLE